MFSFSSPIPTTSASRTVRPMSLAKIGDLRRTEFTLLTLKDLRVWVNMPLSTVTVSPTR